MTDQFTLTAFNAQYNEQAALLAELYQDYLHEEHDRTGHRPAGHPVAPWLSTLLIRWEGSVVGFVSVDLPRHLVDLLYVSPEARREGLATAALRTLAHDDGTMPSLQGPLSPAGLALAHTAGTGLTLPTSAQLDASEAALTAWEETAADQCSHRTDGPCSACYRAALDQYAEDTVVQQITRIRDALRVNLAPAIAYPRPD